MLVCEQSVWTGNLSKVVNGRFQMEKRFRFDEEHCEVDVNNPKKLNEVHSDLLFLPKRMKNGKCQKLDCNLYNKRSYVIHIKMLNQAINHGLIDNRIIEFYKKA